MQKKSIITIAGKPGSGKSTTSKAVAAQLSFRHFSSGDLFRSIANDRGQDVRTANEAAEKESSIDELVDAKLQEIGKNEHNIVIDSRTAWHWMPESFKVYLDLDLEVAASRIIAAKIERHESNEHIPDSLEEYVYEIQRRLDSEVRRYEALYSINPYDTSNYDLVIDTNEHSIDEVIRKVVQSYKNWHSS